MHVRGSFPDLVSPAVESRNLGGALQEATAAFGQMLGHPGVESRDAARQAGLRVR